MRVDPKTHQTLRPYFFMRCKKKDAMKHPMDFADIIATGYDAAAGGVRGLQGHRVGSS